MEAEVVLQVPKDPDNVRNARSQRDSCRDRPRPMVLNQLPHSRLDDVVAAAPVRKNSELIVKLGGPIHADRNADAIFGKELDNGGRQ